MGDIVVSNPYKIEVNDRKELFKQLCKTMGGEYYEDENECYTEDDFAFEALSYWAMKNLYNDDEDYKVVLDIFIETGDTYAELRIGNGEANITVKSKEFVSPTEGVWEYIEEQSEEEGVDVDDVESVLDYDNYYKYAREFNENEHITKGYLKDKIHCDTTLSGDEYIAECEGELGLKESFYIPSIIEDMIENTENLSEMLGKRLWTGIIDEVSRAIEEVKRGEA